MLSPLNQFIFNLDTEIEHWNKSWLCNNTLVNLWELIMTRKVTKTHRLVPRNNAIVETRVHKFGLRVTSWQMAETLGIFNPVYDWLVHSEIQSALMLIV